MTAAPAVMIIIRQPNRQPLTVVLDEELTLGRDCDGLLLADPQVSRQHLRLRRLPDGVEVSDLGSTNGSYLENVPLRQPETVRSTSSILMGDTDITISFGGSVGGNAGGGGPVGTETAIRTVDDLRTTSIELVADAVSAAAASAPVALLGDDDAESETVTIVFSDIESSTDRANEIGDAAWFDLLEEHNVLFREEMARFGGYEVKSVGDGFMITFPSVRKALRFSVAIQRRIEADDGPDLKVRMGLHTGEAIGDGTGDMYGRHVNLAARVANLALGGQILGSLVVREIAIGRDDVVFSDATQVELKGFAELQTVYEIDWEASTIQ